MNELYETKISDARWIAYDLPGNAGWIIYFVCCYHLLKDGINAYSRIALVPALLMLLGILELISERIAKLDRILPRIRLLRGFGALLLGGIMGIMVAVTGLMLGKNGVWPWWMLLGAALCALFAGLLYHGYLRQSSACKGDSLPRTRKQR